MFYNVPVCYVNKWTMLFFSVVIGLGSVMRCGILDDKKDRNALYIVLITSVLIIVALLLSALHPQSTLLSVTGEIKNSPYIHGLPTILVWCIIFLSALYSILSHRVKNADEFVDLLTYGIRRYSTMVLIVMLSTFISSCFTYIFNIII